MIKDPDEEMFESHFKRPSKKEIDDLFDSGALPTNATSNNDHSMEKIIPKPKKQELETPVTLENQYIHIRDKMRDKELSLTDITSEERSIIKQYLKLQSSSLIEGKYPSHVEGLNRV